MYNTATMRIGIGYDVHKLVKDRKLIIGGVEIPYKKGLAGHSDADVLIHAIMDALLGSLSLGSIGDLFPDTDEQFKDANSLELLRKVSTIVGQMGYIIKNVDSVIVCQEPKLQEYIKKMRYNIGDNMMMLSDDVSIKATTTEKLGFEGKGEGISAQAVVLIDNP